MFSVHDVDIGVKKDKGVNGLYSGPVTPRGVQEAKISPQNLFELNSILITIDKKFDYG